MRPIDADVLLDNIRRDSKKAIDEGDKVGSFWLGYIAGLVIKQPTIQSALDSETIIRTIETGITATNSNDAYSLGMRNGMRWCKSLIDGAEPKFEDDVMSVDDGTDSAELPSVQPEPHWIPCSKRMPEDMQFVLLTVRRLKAEYNHEPFISVGYIGWNQTHWWCAHDGDCEISKVEVLAWMPLPEAYKPNNK